MCWKNPLCSDSTDDLTLHCTGVPWRNRNLVSRVTFLTLSPWMDSHATVVFYVLQKTSVRCALGKKVLATKAPASIGSSLNSCARYCREKEPDHPCKFTLFLITAVKSATFLCLGWRLHEPQWNRRQVDLRGEVQWWELPVKALGHGHAVHGQRRAQHKRIPVLHLHGFNWLVSSRPSLHAANLKFLTIWV